MGDHSRAFDDRIILPPVTRLIYNAGAEDFSSFGGIILAGVVGVMWVGAANNDAANEDNCRVQ